MPVLTAGYNQVYTAERTVRGGRLRWGLRDGYPNAVEIAQSESSGKIYRVLAREILRHRGDAAPYLGKLRKLPPAP
jgi:hypothetical protein